MDCVNKCLSSLGGDGENEFGSLTYSPLSFKEIRARQVWSRETLTYTVGNDSKGPIHLRYNYLSQRGLYPDEPDKANQDAFKIMPSFGGEKQTIVMGVFDGHGEYGDDCAEFLRDNIEEQLLAAREEHGNDLEKAFRTAFRQLNSDMHFTKDFSDALSGTTACVAFFERTAVWVANVGDSRAIVGKLSKGALIATPLSTDQTPFRKDERERIRAAGGEIMSVDQREGIVPMHDNWDIDLGTETDTDGDPPRVWVPNKDKPGCAFTRSIGDATGERVGVIADPELTKKELKEHDKFVCICSDGVWEFLTNQSVCDIIGQYEEPLPACRATVAESYRLWLQFDVRTDDITMLLAFVDFEHKRSTGGASGKPVKSRGSIRGSISVGGDNLKKASRARPVRRGFSKEKRAAIASMAGADDEQLSIDDLPREPKSSDEVDRIRQALSTNFLFARLTDDQKDKAYAAMRRVETAKGDTIYAAGDASDAFYLLDSGEYASAVPGQSGGDEEVTMIKATSAVPHPTFGELGLMYSKPRTQTVTVSTPGILWAIDRKVFRAVCKFGGAGSNKQTRALETLKSIDILRSLSGEMLKRLSQGLDEQHFNANDYIVRQGDETQSLYLIMEGHVRCTAKLQPDSPQEELLMELTAGAYFGERSLLNNMPRAANVVATKRTTCLNMSKQTFEEVLGPLQAIIEKDRKTREHNARRRRQMQETEGLEVVSLKDFQVEGLVSEADFGQWVLATHKGTGSEYTLKAVSKEIAAEGAGARVMAEARLAAKIVEPSPFVPLALQTLTSPAYLLTVFKCRAANDLQDVMQKYGPFDEATTLFYAANIFLGLEHLHNVCDVAYRNVTPEAIMLGHDGYAYLMDMRFAKEVDSNKLYDLCGLSPYLAPEQISGVGHTHAVDYWALGILIFEMLTEKTPFAEAGQQEEAIYAKIASHFTGALTFPDAFSLELVGILDRLLEPSISHRICTSKAFRSNPWMEVVNWQMLESCQVPAPFEMEMAKLVAEKKAAGSQACLNALAYSGSTQWFDGFTSQMDTTTAMSFRKSQSSIDFDANGGLPPLPNTALNQAMAGTAPEDRPLSSRRQKKKDAKEVRL